MEALVLAFAACLMAAGALACTLLLAVVCCGKRDKGEPGAPHLSEEEMRQWVEFLEYEGERDEKRA